MVLDRIQRHPGRFPDPGLLCGRFRLDTRIRLADSKRQPLQYAGCGLYRRLRQLLFQCTPADLLDSSLYRTDAFRDCLRCGERHRTGLQDHDATPVLYPGRDVCTLRHAAKCRSGTGVPVQTGFQQTDFIRCTECRRAGVLFAESRHGLPYHLLFLFRERHQHVGNSLAGDDHQYFCGSPGRIMIFRQSSASGLPHRQAPNWYSSLCPMYSSSYRSAACGRLFSISCWRWRH